MHTNIEYARRASIRYRKIINLNFDFLKTSKSLSLHFVCEDWGVACLKRELVIVNKKQDKIFKF